MTVARGRRLDSCGKSFGAALGAGAAGGVMNDASDNLMRTADVARYLSVPKRRVARLRAAAGLPFLNVGGEGAGPIVRYKRADVEAWLAERRRVRTPPEAAAPRAEAPAGQARTGRSWRSVLDSGAGRGRMAAIAACAQERRN